MNAKNRRQEKLAEVFPEHPIRTRRATWLMILLAALTLPAGPSSAAEPWWQTYTPVATLDQRGTGLETIQPGAVRGGSGTLGWYGFWFLDEQDKSGSLQASRQRLQQAGVQRLLYYDLGEVGDYAGFFGADGRLKHNGWSLPWWKDQEFRLVDVDFANPQLRDYCCREIAHLIAKLRPDGIHADNLGDANLGHAGTCAFGLWSEHTFRRYLQRHFTPEELDRVGIADAATFDLRAYIRVSG